MRLARIEHAGETLVASIEGPKAIPVGRGGTHDLVKLCIARTPPAPIGAPIPLADVRLLTPVARPPSFRDFYAFEDHVRTSRSTQGLDMDPRWYEQPVFYFSNPASFLGPDDVVVGPPTSHALDYELEVACVIGSEAADLDPDDPRTIDVVAGFTILNDWSARDLQSAEMTQNLGPSKGKDFATSLGPYLVTPDELPGIETGRLSGALRARVNGELLSAGDLGAMYFTWGQLIAHASANTRLLPGDVLGSGTCGTGCLLELRTTTPREQRPHWLRAGDVVELDVDGLGTLRNSIAG